MKNTHFIIIALWLCQWSVSLFAQDDTLTVMTYNLLNFPNPQNNDPLGNDNARAADFAAIVVAADADVVLMEEFVGYNAWAADLLLSELNALSTKTYARTNTFSAYASDQLGNMFFYNTAKLSLESTTNINQVTTASNGNTGPRRHTHYRTFANDPNLSQHGIKTYLDFFAIHLKASDTSTDEDIRRVGCVDLMNYLENTTALTNSNIIVGGDCNFYNETETGYQTLTDATTYSNNYLTDVKGAWTRTSPCCVASFTQATRNGITNLFGNGGISGGLDDRFDFLFMNDETLLQGNGNSSIGDVVYINNSYKTFGSEGVPLDGNASEGTSSVKNELYHMSDHYPVIFKVSVTYPNPNLLCDISNVSIGTQTACDSLTNTYTQQVTLTYSDAPSTGNLVVNNQAFPVTGSPQTVTLTNLTANGAAVDISAYFSDESLCAYFQSAAFTAAAACVTLCPLVINGVFDGTLAGGYPKGVELLALDNIPDLSIYSILVTFNGVSTSTITYTLPTGSLLAGEYYYVTNSLLEFSNFFGCTANFEAAISINGDDAVQVLCNGSVSDTFGDINVDGTGTAWEYLDGWASRVAGGPDGNTFILTNWSFGGVGALNGGTTNVTTNTPFPIQQCPATDCEITNVSAGTPSACNSVDNTYTVAITVEYINEPATGNLLIEGQSFAITTSPQTETITLTADGNAKNIWVQFSDDLNCGLLGTNLFTAPQACATISAPLVITGLYDGPLVGGAPKGVELYVLNDIPDLSIYGLGSANNGGGTDGQEFTFPAVSVSAGTCIFVASESIEFTNFFGFAPDYTSGSMAINGDDAIELFGNGEVIDVFGDINASGSGTAWDYLDGWVYRVDNTGPDGNVFNINNWTFSGINALDNETTNATAAIPYPTCTYSVAACEIDIILGNPADNSTDQSNNQSATNSIVASNSIVFSANLGLMMSYTAGNFLDFTEGFNVNADNNSLFEAKIQACSGAAKNEGVIKPIYIAPLTSLDIMVAPNPGHDIVHVFIKNLNSSAMLNLHDMMGNSIFRKSLSPTQNDISIALPQLPAGIYLLNVIEEKVQKFSRKIIIL